jgi:UDP-GlcNAc:undecaprenyl-phosphate GlcNAc-1-phosphate transferase
MTVTLVIITFILLLLLELVYFRIADRFQIIDQPNNRSSHTEITIRGGGIIFPIALLLFPLYFGLAEVWFLIGLFLISLISFTDDIKHVNNKLRLTIHLAAVGLLFYQMGIFDLSWYLILFAFFFTIGTINAINFMDGINGITGGYGLITLASLYFINQWFVSFTDPNLLITAIIAVVVFNVFNFRKKARCFAGDVGSVSLGFIIVYFILSLILKTENFNYILLLLVYGLDVVSTTIFRMIRKENVMEPHRSHFYQYLYNDRKIPQVIIAIIYMFMQLLVNILLVYTHIESIWIMLAVLFVSGIVFVKMRFMFEGTERLLG